jgi:hypothetical protein
MNTAGDFSPLRNQRDIFVVELDDMVNVGTRFIRYCDTHICLPMASVESVSFFLLCQAFYLSARGGATLQPSVGFAL